MHKFLSSSLVLTVLVGLGMAGFAPLRVEAKVLRKKQPVVRQVKRPVPIKQRVPIRSKNEGLVAAHATSSRCLTQAMRAMHVQALRQMDADFTQTHVTSSNAAATYRKKMEMIWAAMAEPYCGHGSRGLSAVRHSFNKSVNKTRNAFFNERKEEWAASQK